MDTAAVQQTIVCLFAHGIDKRSMIFVGKVDHIAVKTLLPKGDGAVQMLLGDQHQIARNHIEDGVPDKVPPAAGKQEVQFVIRVGMGVWHAVAKGVNIVQEFKVVRKSYHRITPHFTIRIPQEKEKCNNLVMDIEDSPKFWYHILAYCVSIYLERVGQEPDRCVKGNIILNKRSERHEFYPF